FLGRKLEFGRDPALAHLRQPDLVDARVLILELDLIATVLEAAREGLLFLRIRVPELALLRRRRVADSTEGSSDVPRGFVAGDEVLVKLHLARWKARTVRPVDAREVGIALIPQERVARAAQREDEGAGIVPVRLLVRGGCDLRDVGMHHAVGEEE